MLIIAGYLLIVVTFLTRYLWRNLFYTKIISRGFFGVTAGIALSLLTIYAINGQIILFESIFIVLIITKAMLGYKNFFKPCETCKHSFPNCPGGILSIQQK